MKVLLVGGSGMVGTFVTPYLARHHELRVMDIRPAQHADLVEYVEGSISNPATSPGRSTGWTPSSTWSCAIRARRRWSRPSRTSSTTTRSTRVGVHLLLWTAQRLGIKHGIYVSTRTVHNLTPGPDGRPMYFQAEETMPLDSRASTA